jgi:hypothetical protein
MTKPETAIFNAIASNAIATTKTEVMSHFERIKRAIAEPFLSHVSGAYGELLAAAENTEHAQAAREALVEAVELAKSYGFTRKELH